MSQEKKTIKKTTVKINEMPHSYETEEAMLGCVLLDNEIQNDVLLTLSDDDFYSNANRVIFSAMKGIIKSNTLLDFYTLADKLEREGIIEEAGGIEHLTEIASAVTSTANYNKYLSILHRDGVLRRLIHASNCIIEKSLESVSESDAVAFAEKSVYDIAQKQATENLYQAKDVVPEILHKFDVISRDKSAYFGIRTGFERLDRITNGLQNGDMIVIGARPSCGKTSLGMNIVENAAIMYGKKCMVFSLEMGKAQLVQRMLCSVAEIDMGDAIRAQLNKTQWKRLEEAREHISKADITINDSAIISPKEILSICRRVKQRKGLDLILIDYIGLLSPDEKNKNNNRQNEVSEISKGLKAIAKDINVPVIVLAQLSRVAVNDKTRGVTRKPQLSDLRESGSIEQDADIVMLIHRPDKVNNSLSEEDKAKNNIKSNVAEIYVEKQRNGATGMFKLFFKDSCTKFVDYNEEEHQEEESLPDDLGPKELKDDGFKDDEQFENIDDDKPYEYDDDDGSIFGE